MLHALIWCISVFLPKLEKGTWVLCDRFTDSTVAYQGYGHGLGYNSISELNHFTVGDLVPDLTFIFEMSPEVGLERTEFRDKVKGRFEKYDMNFHRRVAEGFSEVLRQNHDRCVPINALLDIDMISELIVREVSQRFELPILAKG